MSAISGLAAPEPAPDGRRSTRRSTTGDALVATVGFAVFLTTLGAWLLQRRDLT